jgi:FAD/FMN-containing dehydrogenase
MSWSVVWRDQAAPEKYEQARIKRVFNRERPERYPLAIVFVTEESNIVDAVNLAIKNKCSISVRSGGHSWPVWSVRDEAILLDLGDYSEITLDENTGIVRVSPSTTAIELHDYLSARGRVFSVGHCPDVGVGGALLCGGMGWNCNVWYSYIHC